MNAKKILVTGGAGYIGSHMLLRLMQTSWEVIVVDNLSTGLQSNLIYGQLIQGDLRDKAFVEALFSQHTFDAVIHFAASTSVPESIEKPELYYDNNTLATFYLIEACLKHQVKCFLLSSTAAVYGLKKDGIVDESSTTNPMNPYGQSKLLAEKMLQDCFKAHDFSYTILRYFNVAGVDDSLQVGPSPNKASHLLKAVVDTLLGKQDSLEIYGDDYDTLDGTGVRDFIHVNDIIEAHWLVLNQMFNQPMQALYNCGYGQGFSVKQVIEVAQKLYDKPIPTTMLPRRDGDCPMMITHPTQLKQDLNWAPKYNSLEKMLSSLHDWSTKT